MMERSTLTRVSGGDLRRRDDKEEGSWRREKTRRESWERGEGDVSRRVVSTLSLYRSQGGITPSVLLRSMASVSFLVKW